jgi:probable phosphoglycerate mutase
VTRIILWRHGQTEWNVDNRVQGQTDVELSAVGQQQAKESAVRLAARRPDIIASSDLRRAADTATALSALVGLPIRYDERFRERFFGDWQGLTHPEIIARWPDAHARWRAGEPVGEAGIEELDALAKRMAAALQELVTQAAPNTTIVVATHGGVARHGAAALLGWPEAVTKTLGPLDNCHCTELRFDAVRGWTLRAHNVL